MKPNPKTNAMRMLEAQNIPYELCAYEVTEDHIEAEQVANQLGVAPDMVYKTLVARNQDKEVFVFCVPSSHELDLKKAAKASGSKKMALIGVKQLLPLTGYIRGGCSPLAMKKEYPTIIEEAALLSEFIYVNAGQRGLLIKLSPVSLLKVCKANAADLV